MRFISITRERKFVGGGGDYYVYIDDKNYGTIDNGETLEIQLDSKQHSVYICGVFSDVKSWSEKHTIPAGTINCSFVATHKTRLTTVDVILFRR